jgi:hypothetical protein
LREKIAEAKANDGVVRLSEILKQQEQAKAEGAAETVSGSAASGSAVGVVGEGASSGAVAPGAELADPDDEARSPQVDEALWILADLITLAR